MTQTLEPKPFSQNCGREEDQAWVEAFKAGDQAAFNRIVRKYRKMVYSVAYRYVHNHEEADDLAQETFVRAFGNLKDFRGDAALTTWLLRITTNLSINVVKSGRVSKDSGNEVQDFMVMDKEGAEKELITSERQRALRKAIQTLPPRQKEALMLKTYQDMTCEQVAKVMDCSVGTVKANIFNALNKLKTRLKEA